jgi:hypothetical protein
MIVVTMSKYGKHIEAFSDVTHFSERSESYRFTVNNSEEKRINKEDISGIALMTDDGKAILTHEDLDEDE